MEALLQLEEESLLVDLYQQSERLRTQLEWQ
jgi:hypothetical protein